MALDAIVRLMAPVLAFTAEEVYDNLPGKEDAVSVHCLNFPAEDDTWLDEGIEKRVERVLEFQEEVNKVLDKGQKEKLIGHPNDARIVMSAAPDDLKFLRETESLSDKGESLAHFFRVSDLDIVDEPPEGGVKSEEIEGLVIKLERAPGEKCERCWMYSPDTGIDPAHPGICPRCTRVVKVLEG